MKNLGTVLLSALLLMITANVFAAEINFIFDADSTATFCLVDQKQSTENVMGKGVHPLANLQALQCGLVAPQFPVDKTARPAVTVAVKTIFVTTVFEKFFTYTNVGKIVSATGKYDQVGVCVSSTLNGNCDIARYTLANVDGFSPNIPYAIECSSSGNGQCEAHQ